MARLRIEVDDNLTTRMYVDDEQVGVLQTVKFSADRNHFAPNLFVELTDVETGRRCAAKIQGLSFAQVKLIPLGEEEF